MWSRGDVGRRAVAVVCAAVRTVLANCALLLGWLITVGFMLAVVLTAIGLIVWCVGPTLPIAWLVVAIAWMLAYDRVAPGWLWSSRWSMEVLPWIAVGAQIFVDDHWRYTGDVLFVLGHVIVISTLPRPHFPRATLRRTRRCSNG